MSLEAQDSLTTRTTRGHLILLFFVISVQATIQFSISIYFPLNSKSETITIKYGEYQSSQEGGQQ